MTTRSWDGGAINANWTTAGNWFSNLLPVEGDDLTFPSGAARLSNQNDFPADTDFLGLLFTGNGYILSGNRLELDPNSGGGIADTSTGGTNTLNLSLLLAANTTVNVANDGQQLVFNGIISSGSSGFGLTKVGTGLAILNGVNTYLGATQVNGGTLQIGNSASIATSATTINGGILEVQGIAGSVILNTGGTLTSDSAATVGILEARNGVVSPGGDQAVGVLETATLTLAQPSTLQVNVGNSQATSDQLNAGSNNVTLNNAALAITGNLAFGTPVTIINSTGTLTGQFSIPNLQPGNLWVNNGMGLRIRYEAGDAILERVATVNGRVLQDSNGNGTLEGNETTGIAGRTVFVDANDNGVKDTLEISSLTDAEGDYSLPIPTAGAYTVKVVGDGVTTANPRTVTVAANSDITGENFGVATTVVGEFPSLTLGDVTVTEGNAGTTTATFLVTLSASPSIPVTVNYSTANQSAIVGLDFKDTQGQLTFAAEATGNGLKQAIDVPVLGDLLVEGTKTFTVHLSAPTNATLNKSSGTGTILDNDTNANLGEGKEAVDEGTRNNDFLVGTGQADRLFGNQGQDTILGQKQADTLYGGKGADWADGGKGGDVLFGSANADTLFGSNDNDSLFGGTDNDVLFGGKGNDWGSGDLGNDLVSGDKGNDTLVGVSQSSDNSGFGQGERDTLIGGEGGDRFILGDTQRAYYNNGNNTNSGTGDYVLISDFNLSEDTLQLKSGLAYVTGSVTNGLPSGVGLFIDDDGIAGRTANDELIAVLYGVDGDATLTSRFVLV